MLILCESLETAINISLCDFSNDELNFGSGFSASTANTYLIILLPVDIIITATTIIILIIIPFL